MGQLPRGAPQRAELTGVDHGFQIGEQWIGALVEHHCEGDLGVCYGTIEQADDLFAVDSGGFFEKHMDTVLDRLDGHARMLVVRSGDDDRVHCARVEQLAVIGEQRHAHLLGKDRVRLVGTAVGVRTAQRREFERGCASV